MKLTSYLENWLVDQKARLQLSTWEAYTVYVRLHLIGYFSRELELDELTPVMVQRYVTDKLQNGRADGSGGLCAVSVRKHLSVLKQALNDAVNFGLIRFNPAASVRMPRTIAPEEPAVFLTLHEAKTLLSALQGEVELYPIVLVTLYYGLRRSEVLGLKWIAVDLDNGTLSIRHTVVKSLTIEAKDSTKTLSSRRTFKLLPEILEVLKPLQNGAKLTDYVFHRADGSPLRPDTLTRGFQRALQRSGLPSMRFHDLRHSTASILFDLGWQLEDVKQWLGHADIETTSNIYLHYSAQRKVLRADSLAGILISTQNEKER